MGFSTSFGMGLHFSWKQKWLNRYQTVFSLWWSGVLIPRLAMMTWKYTWSMDMCLSVQLAEMMSKWRLSALNQQLSKKFTLHSSYTRMPLQLLKFWIQGNWTEKQLNRGPLWLSECLRNDIAAPGIFGEHFIIYIALANAIRWKCASLQFTFRPSDSNNILHMVRSHTSVLWCAVFYWLPGDKSGWQ